MKPQDAPTPTSLNSEPQQTNGHTASPVSPKRSTAKGWLLVVVIVFLGAAVGVGLYLQHVESAESETIAYNTLENNDNPKDYEAFLDKYPDSPRAPEVKRRLKEVQRMLQRWATIALSDQAADFVRFKQHFNHPHYLHLCDIKIDSLDFVQAQRLGTEASFQSYLDAHPDGRYASEASIAQGMLRDQEVAPQEREQVVMVLQNFFEGFASRDEALICSNITATMDQFLHQSQVTKADVVQTIDNMFNEHIVGCQFVVNRDIQVVRLPGDPTTAPYQVNFTIDQHIQRDDEGKTFGSYRATAQVTPQLLISSLTLQELSRQ